jgi:hypothetical protein
MGVGRSAKTLGRSAKTRYFEIHLVFTFFSM